MNCKYTIAEIDSNGFRHNLFIVETIEDVFDYIHEYEEAVHMKGKYEVNVSKGSTTIGNFRI